MSDQQLLPCPFCGGPGDYNNVQDWHGVGCQTRHCPGLRSGLYHRSKEAAFAAWNRRAPRLEAAATSPTESVRTSALIAATAGAPPQAAVTNSDSFRQYAWKRMDEAAAAVMQGHEYPAPAAPETACQSCGGPATRDVPNEATDFHGPYCNHCGPGAVPTTYAPLEQFAAYLKECDEGATVPNVPGAFNWAWAAAFRLKGAESPENPYLPPGYAASLKVKAYKPSDFEGEFPLDVPLLMGSMSQPSHAPVAGDMWVVSRRQAEDIRSALLWTLWHHQGGSSNVGQPIRRLLGIGQHDNLTPEQVADAKAWAQSQWRQIHRDGQ